MKSSSSRRRARTPRAFATRGAWSTPMRTVASPDRHARRDGLAKIHIAKKQLGLDDETYRAMLWTIARVRSAADLDFTGRQRVLHHLRKRGFQGKPGAQPAPAPMDAQVAKIRALWIELRDQGGITDGSEKALQAFVRRQTGVDALAWLSTGEASDVIESLKKWLARVESKARQGAEA